MFTHLKVVQCPNCGSGEMHPTKDQLLVRALKVHDKAGWWSQCLVCAGYYDSKLNHTPDCGDPAIGWFCDPD